MNPVLDTANNATYLNFDRANKVVQIMNNDADDDWYYEVVDVGNGKAYIVSYDNCGQYVGKL